MPEIYIYIYIYIRLLYLQQHRVVSGGQRECNIYGNFQDSLLSEKILRVGINTIKRMFISTEKYAQHKKTKCDTVYDSLLHIGHIGKCFLLTRQVDLFLILYIYISLMSGFLIVFIYSGD